MKKAVLIGLLLILLSACDIKPTHPAVKVNEKAVKVYNNSSTYLVFTDKGVYEVADAMSLGHFTASDVYGSIEVGKCYSLDIHTLSWRHPFFSTYENIIKANEIDCDTLETISKNK